METQAKPMTGKEKLRRLIDTKKQAQQEARDRYTNDAEYRAVFEKLREQMQQEQHGAK
ncbi:hypothetical protein [Fibrella aquatilis]|uniref:Uncharacterized protein n=1 Tax=Fibrella aquatilis TaxID=2817059 RepID=A0A939G4X0_9BACT|nr:hypothetical protein [Fibrella aquatilis]MBO0929853.1 hypothetical protein [Fibrella aquatilis]